MIGARVKCKKCGTGFTVAESSAKAVTGPPVADATPSAPEHVIAVEGLDELAWTAAGSESPSALGTSPTGAATIEDESATAQEKDGQDQFVSQEHGQRREYKLLTPRDKIFDGKFDLGRLEEAVNYYARQGWVVKAMSTPHVKNFQGVLQEELVVLLER